MHRIASVLPLLLAALVFVLVSATSPSARTWHILPDGSGDAPTIQAAFDSAAVGDTVLVACGVYHESDLTLSTSITLQGTSGGAQCVVLDIESAGSGIHADGVDSLAVQGMTFANALTFALSVTAATPGSPVAVHNCVFDATTAGSGLKLDGVTTIMLASLPRTYRR